MMYTTAFTFLWDSFQAWFLRRVIWPRKMMYKCQFWQKSIFARDTTKEFLLERITFLHMRNVHVRIRSYDRMQSAVSWMAASNTRTISSHYMYMCSSSTFYSPKTPSWRRREPIWQICNTSPYCCLSWREARWRNAGCALSQCKWPSYRRLRSLEALANTRRSTDTTARRRCCCCYLRPWAISVTPKCEAWTGFSPNSVAWRLRAGEMRANKVRI